MVATSIHRADEDEKVAAYRNAHEAWGGSTPVDEWVEQRLESPRHNRAEWWVLTEDGEVAASLGRYALSFRYEGASIDGFGLGAVHTAPEYRRKGYASRLCERVHESSADQGFSVGLLYSDIDPDFYRALGYAVASELRFESSELRDIAEGGARAGLHPVDAKDRLDELMIWYDEAHRGYGLFLERDRAYWESAIEEQTGHRFFGISLPGGRMEGYVRVKVDGDTLQILELVLPDAEPELGAASYRALADLALARGWERIRQFFAPPRPVLPHFDENRRDQAVAMLAPVAEDVDFDDAWLRQNARIWQGDQF